MPGKHLLRPLFFSALITLLILYQFPLKGEVPFPGKLLVGRLFPWNSQDWPGYPTGVPYKEFISADTIRQTYPWRQLAISQLKQGQMPWWNPYAFSGTPLLANLQSAPFYPLNFLYFFLNFQTTWIIQVFLQPILAIFFTYLFARSIKLPRLASIFAGVIFAFSGFMTVWLELNTVGHAALWLPLILYSINKAFYQPRYYFLTFIGFTSSILAGHIQTTLYLVIFSLIYLIFHRFQSWPQLKQPQRRTHLILPPLTLLLALLISSIQLLPAWQLLSLSPRSGPDPEIFTRFLLPFKHLITFLAPNFFGNPATNNYWSRDYNEFLAYFGFIPFLLVLTSFFIKPKSPTTKFFLSTFIVSLLFSLNQPLSHFPLWLNLPVLSSSAPSRLLYLNQFSAAILAAYALALLSRQLKTKYLQLNLLLITTLSLLAAATLILWQTSPDIVWQAQWRVAFRNLAIPLALSVASLVGARFLLHHPDRSRLFILFVFSLTLLDISLFANKYLPFSPPKFIFPPNRLFSQVKSAPGYYRFSGYYVAQVTSNTWLPYQLFSPDGYDSLYLKRYGQLISSITNQGKIPPTLNRSDANLPPNQEDFFLQRIQDLLAVKHIVYKLDLPPSDWFHDELRLPRNRYRLAWQQDKYQLYSNTASLPRTFLVPHFVVLTQPQKILDQIFDPNFDPSQTIILETSPQWPSLLQASTQKIATSSATITSYSPNQVEFSVSTPTPQLLFVSDAFYPGWKATINHHPLPLYRANFAFRAVPIPPGTHQVVMHYQPTFSDFFQLDQ